MKATSRHPERIVCPHCGYAEAGRAGSVYLVHALSAEEEACFNTANPIDNDEFTEGSV